MVSRIFDREGCWVNFLTHLEDSIANCWPGNGGEADFSASVEMTIPLGSKKTSNGKGNRRSFDCVAHEVL